MCVAPKLCGCRVNMTCFIKDYKSLMAYFQNEGQMPVKHQFDCKCGDSNTCFSGMEFLA